MESLSRRNHVINSQNAMLLVLLLSCLCQNLSEEQMKLNVLSKEFNSNVTRKLETNMEMNGINNNSRNGLKDTGTKTCLKEISNTSEILSCLTDLNLYQSKSAKHDNISLVFGKYRQTKHGTISKTKKLLSIGNSDLSKHETGYILKCKSQLAFICTETLVKFAILLKVIHYVSTKWHKRCAKSSDDKEKLKQKPYEFLFQLRERVYCSVNIYMYPQPLKQYLNGLEKKSDKTIKCMNNEWARFESFKTFPADCPASTLKLAKSGFYSTENGQEAICFSCGVKNDIWTDSETVVDVHKRLSPDCKFLNGDTTENVSIHADDTESHGACGGPEDNNTYREEPNQSNRERNGHETSQNYEREKEHVTSPTAISNEIRGNNSSENGRNLELHNSRQGRYTGNIPTEEIRHFPGITNEQPKHPDYAIKSERLSSYSCWTSTNIVKPEDLADAGFFSCAQ